MGVNKWAKILAGACYDLPEDVGSPGAAESEATEPVALTAALDPAGADLATGAAGVGLSHISAFAVQDDVRSDNPLGVLCSLMVKASFSAAEGLAGAGCTFQMAALAVSATTTAVVMTEPRPLRGLAVGFPGLDPRAVVRMGASSIKAMVLANMLGAASAQGGLLLNKVVR